MFLLLLQLWIPKTTAWSSSTYRCSSLSSTQPRIADASLSLLLDSRNWHCHPIRPKPETVSSHLPIGVPDDGLRIGFNHRRQIRAPKLPKWSASAWERWSTLRDYIFLLCHHHVVSDLARYHLLAHICSFISSHSGLQWPQVSILLEYRVLWFRVSRHIYYVDMAHCTKLNLESTVTVS